MNVHDIHAKRDAALVTELREAGSAIEPPSSLDPLAMATRAVRNVRRRRMAAAVTAGFAVLALTGAGIGVAGSVYADRPQLLPGNERTSKESVRASRSPSAGTSGSSAPRASDAPDSEPAQYLETGGGTLPVLANVEHGVVDGPGGSPYILGGLWYEVPPGGWYAVGDVNAGGEAGFLEPSDPRGMGADMSIDDLDATLELRNVTDVADWTAPARDSGATTLDIEGADLVVIEQHEQEGAIRPATIRIRSGGEGWVIDTRFAADEQGETMLRNFVGNLWLKDAGEPDWFTPQFEHPELEPIGSGVPAGWARTEHNGLKFAVPKGWSSERTAGEFSPGVEWTGKTVTHDDTSDGFERVYVQGGKPGGNWWSQTFTAPESQLIEVPGADYAEVQPTLNNTGGEPDFYTASIYLHQEGQGENLFLVVDFDGTEQGWADLNAFLGTLDFSR